MMRVCACVRLVLNLDELWERTCACVCIGELSMTKYGNVGTVCPRFHPSIIGMLVVPPCCCPNTL